MLCRKRQKPFPGEMLGLEALRRAGWVSAGKYMDIKYNSNEWLNEEGFKGQLGIGYN